MSTFLCSIRNCFIFFFLSYTVYDSFGNWRKWAGADLGNPWLGCFRHFSRCRRSVTLDSLVHIVFHSQKMAKNIQKPMILQPNMVKRPNKTMIFVWNKKIHMDPRVSWFQRQGRWWGKTRNTPRPWGGGRAGWKRGRQSWGSRIEWWNVIKPFKL